MRRISFKSHKQKGDYSIGIIAIVLSFVGILMVYEASSSQAFRDFGDKFYFLKEQLKSLLIGLFGMGIAMKFDYRKLYNLAVPLLLFTLLLLLLVFVPPFGIAAYGAHRWVNIGFTTLQPSEFAKLATTIYLASWFTYKEKNRLLAFILLLSIVVGLILLEPDMGTAIIMGLTGVALYFFSGASITHFLLMAPVGLICGIFLAKAAPYRFQRILTFFDSSKDPLGASYHVRQVLIALGSGGLFGLGLGKSRQKYEYLPEATTDSIFAIIAEEVGFVGSLILIFVFASLIFKGYKIALNSKDRFGMLLASGITSFLAFQTVINLGAMTAILPIVGVPLPFISYGGSSLVISLTSIGILINIANQNG